MKIQLLAIIFSCMFSTFIFSQKTNVLVWDAATPTSKSLYWELDAEDAKKHKNAILVDTTNGIYWAKTKKLRIKSNELLAVKIINANPYKYVYTVEGRVIDFFEDDKSDIDSLLDKLREDISNAGEIDKTEDREENGLELPIQDVNDDESKVDSILNKATELHKEGHLKKVKDLSDEIIETAEKIEEENFDAKTTSSSRGNILLANSIQLSTVKQDLNQELKGIRSKIDTYETLIIAQVNLIDKQKANIKIYQENEKQLKAKLEELQKAKESLVKERDSLKKELRKKIAYESVREEVFGEISKLKALRFRLECFLINLKNEDFLKLNEVENCDGTMKDFHALRLDYKKEFDFNTQNISQVLSKYEGKLKKEDVDKVNKLIEDIYNPNQKVINDELQILAAMKTYHYYSPIEFDGENADAVHVEITRTLRDNSNSKETFDYEIWVKEGFKIDVSAGVFFSSLENRQYVFAPETIMSAQMDSNNNNDMGQGQTDSDGIDSENQNEGNAIIRDNIGGWEYGFGTMLNVTYRNGNWVRPTFGFGAMLTNDTQFQFLFGGGAVFGKKSRVILNAGLAVGRVNRLGGGFVDDGTTRFDIENESNIPIEAKFAADFFLGITYNLGKVKSAND